MHHNKDYELSQRLRGELNALSYQCWYSAKRALAHLDARARYVEGWAVTTDGLVVEHGWCQAGGRIIDSALPGAELTYFAGLCFDALQLEMLDRDPYTPIAWQLYGRGGCENPEYVAAFEAACHFARVNEPAHPSDTAVRRLGRR